MELLVVAPLLILLGNKIMDLVKMVQEGNHRGAVTQLVTFLVCIGLVFLFAATPLAAGIAVGELSLVGASAATKVVFGLLIGAGASGVHDTQRAIAARGK